jgi:hypothetical protein
MSKTFSTADVAAHKDADSGIYIIVDENVYDVTGIYPFPLSPPLIPPLPSYLSPLSPTNLPILPSSAQ